MPYSSAHKVKTRAKIVEAARILFNRQGFETVTIDSVMNEIGLTRGGFYNHFKTKSELFSEAISSFLTGCGAEWRTEAGVNPDRPTEMPLQMVQGYLSTKHLGDLDNQCPMIALPSDAARADPQVQEAYQKLLTSMVWLFEQNPKGGPEQTRQRALSLTALCVGGMVLARTLPSDALADEVRSAAEATAMGMLDAS